MSKKKPQQLLAAVDVLRDYDGVLSEIVSLLEKARRLSARAVNSVITAAYWEVGRRIVEYEQGGRERATYGQELLDRLAVDLTRRFGRGFGRENLRLMRLFYVGYPVPSISQMPSGKLQPPISQTASGKLQPPISQTASGKLQSPPTGIDVTLAEAANPGTSELEIVARCFPLPWSDYVLLLKVDKPDARQFYEAEALRNGWTVKQLERQITTLFYERTLASKKKGAMLKKGAVAQVGDVLSAEEEIKDPLLLEFLGLKDEYSESDLEEALIRELEAFLLELGGDFTFVGRQKRLRIDDEWYRIDLLFFHRKLRCLVIVDLKLGKFTHADAGQMHLYLNYARHHWTNDGENPPVGVILCTQKGAAVAHYALEGLPNKILAAEYRTTLPNEKTLVAELERKRQMLESRVGSKKGKGGQA